MSKVTNTSSTHTLYGASIATHQPNDPPSSWQLRPGETFEFTNADKTPGAWYFYTSPSSSGSNPAPFWKGLIRSKSIVNVDPVTEHVYVSAEALTEADLNRLKAHFPLHKEVQATTLAQLKINIGLQDYHGIKATGVPGVPIKRSELSDCLWSASGLVMDIVLLAWGAVGLKHKINNDALRAISGAIEPSLNAIEHIAETLSREGATLREKADAIKDILLLIYSGGMLEAIFKAIISSLTWWDMMLYGTLGMAELTAAFLTDGAAVIAVVVVELAQAGFVISDGAKAYHNCSNYLSAPKIGDRVGGGIIFYIDSTGKHGLIAAPENMPSPVIWGNSGNSVLEARRSTIGTGKENTAAILAVTPDPNTAAGVCVTCNFGHYSGWYLPSKDELNIMYLNRVAIGGFDSNLYWSSSEFGNGIAWFQSFFSGSQRDGIEYNTLYVRAIRSF